MMKKILYFLFFINTYAYTQSTFNHQINIPEFPFHVLTTVLPTDSCFYSIGVITDTAGQAFAIGNLFVKFDMEGEMEFYKKLSSPQRFYETWLADLLPTDDGGFMSVGTVSDQAYSFVLIKYDSKGDTVSTSEILNPLYPSTSIVYAADLVEGLDGSLFILGRVDSEELLNPDDVYLFKTNESGGLQETYTYGDASSEIPFSMIQDDDGGLIIGSVKTNLGQVSSNFYSRTHIFKVDSYGQKVWEYQTPNSDLFNIGRDMVKASDGGIVVATGKGIEHVINSEDSQLRWHSYLLKLNADHQKEWGIELRGTRHSGTTGFLKVVASPDGYGYTAVGKLLEDVSIGEEVFGSWVAKVSPEGDSLWARYYSFFDSIEASPRPYDLKTTPDGGYVIVGETRPKLPSGQVQRAWIMKLDRHGCLIPDCHGGDTVVVNTNQPVESQVKLAIYPNPTSDFLNFQLRSAMPIHEARFRVVDASGRVVKELESRMPKETHIVPVRGWAAGVYFLQYVEGGVVRGSERFVVLKN